MRSANLATGPAPTRTDKAIDPRLDFWNSAAEILGIDPNQLDCVDTDVDPLLLIDLVLPASSSEERSELLWALGEFERRQP